MSVGWFGAIRLIVRGLGKTICTISGKPGVEYTITMHENETQTQKPSMSTEEKVAVVKYRVVHEGVKLKRACADIGLPKETYHYHIRRQKAQASAEAA